MFVISKLNIKSKSSELINMFKSEEECIKCITENLNPGAIHKIKLDNNIKTIEEYERKGGYLFNSECLTNIYQILPLPENTKYTSLTQP